MSASAKLMDLATFELDNGLQVAVIEHHKAPVALQMLYYKTGSVNDPKGKGGIAHLLEHLMFRGTQKVKDGEFNRQMTELGAESNAFTIVFICEFQAGGIAGGKKIAVLLGQSAVYDGSHGV